MKKTLDTEFAGFKIDEAEISESAEGTFYEFELEKGKVEKEVTIDASGKVIKQENSTEEGENDND